MYKIYKYLYILLCFLFLVSLIWYKFIREHLPKNIPLNLSLFNFIALLIICLHFINIITIFCLQKKNNNVFLINIQVLLKKQIIFLTNELHITEYFLITQSKSTIKLLQVLLAYPGILLFLETIMRILVMVVFVYDVFSNKLSLTYNFAWSFIIIYCIKYIIISLNIFKENRMNYIMERATFNILSPIKFLSLDEFITAQTINVISKKPLIDYILVLNFNYLEGLHKSLNLKPTQKINGKVFGNSLRKIFNVVLLINHVLVLNNKLYTKYNFINICISSIYLIGWLYILFISFHTLPPDSFLVLDVRNICYEEPFSNLSLFEANETSPFND